MSYEEENTSSFASDPPDGGPARPYSYGQPAVFVYNGGVTVDREKPLTGKELEELIERDKEATASLACEGIYLYP